MLELFLSQHKEVVDLISAIVVPIVVALIGIFSVKSILNKRKNVAKNINGDSIQINGDIFYEKK